MVPRQIPTIQPIHLDWMYRTVRSIRKNTLPRNKPEFTSHGRKLHREKRSKLRQAGTLSAGGTPSLGRSPVVLAPRRSQVRRKGLSTASPASQGERVEVLTPDVQLMGKGRVRLLGLCRRKITGYCSDWHRSPPSYQHQCSISRSFEPNTHAFSTFPYVCMSSNRFGNMVWVCSLSH